MQELNLIHAHKGRAAPVSPRRFVMFIVVVRREVYHRMHEA